MSKSNQSITEPCKLFKLLGENAPDFCNRFFSPRVEWQKFCSNKNKCHDRYWKIVYQEKALVDKRLDRLEKKTGIKS